ncbi:hypothetical protein [Fortiea contorta]|uniref:hypothetical protein n=1 Tax=Fortiea contorta TaxID=1892405 RepID=UPI00034B2321|nr:hypothetical protein [Fortiea contorta]
MNFNANFFVALCSFALALFTTATGAILWYVNSEKKKYASERDFLHLKRNQEQISQAIAQVMIEMDRRLDLISHDILEIKAEFRHKDKL